MNNPVIIISAPSGAGKSTLVQHLLACFPSLEFSVSATSRPPRGAEVNGKEYHFLSKEAFEQKVKEQAFVEWEEVYVGFYYGTLKSELERICSKGHLVLFDVDVKGGIRLKQIFGAEALSIFIQPPSLEVLQQRLEARGTDTPESIQRRVAKAAQEIQQAPHFDCVVVNDVLAQAQKEMVQRVSDFLE